MLLALIAMVVVIIMTSCMDVIIVDQNLTALMWVYFNQNPLSTTSPVVLSDDAAVNLLDFTIDLYCVHGYCLQLVQKIRRPRNAERVTGWSTRTDGVNRVALVEGRFFRPGGKVGAGIGIDGENR